jgi:hypothetical protein
MSINKFNAEGYFDPTAYEALTNIEHEAKKQPFRPLVFICSPYAGDIERNTTNARRYSRFAVQENYIPLAPHLLFPQFLDDTNRKERDLGLFFGMVLMSKCTQVWVFGDVITAGMTVEIEKAKRRKLVLRYFDTDCKEVSADELSKGAY